MESPREEAKTQQTRQSQCDYCNEQTAVLYCSADNAKLCLICDQHVHSANTLSKKHIRSQICNHCYKSPVTLHCVTHNLLLCQDCDFNMHSLSDSHDRTPIDGVTGCPTPLQLASYWGFDLPSQMVPCFDESDGFFDCSEFVVPGDDHDDVVGIKLLNKAQDLHGVGREQKLVVIKQLIELWKRDGGGGEEEREDVVVVPGGGDVDVLVGLVNDEECEQMNLDMNGGGVGVNSISRCNPPSQIWDFSSGVMRGHKESRQLDQNFCGSDVSFVMNNYGTLIGESELATSNMLGDVYEMNCSNTRDNIGVFNSNSDDPTWRQGPATSESNNMPITRPSSSINHSVYLQVDNARMALKTQGDLELIAQIRGNAMQRYKDKKKTRRFDKQVRYESRKARADTRKRVKGRFVKSLEA